MSKMSTGDRCALFNTLTHAVCTEERGAADGNDVVVVESIDEQTTTASVAKVMCLLSAGYESLLDPTLAPADARRLRRQQAY
jgi:hypothetical protein